MKTIKTSLFLFGIVCFFSISGYAADFYDIDNPGIKKATVHLSAKKSSRLNNVFVSKLRKLLEQTLLFQNVSAKDSADYILEIEKSVEDKEIVLNLIGGPGSQVQPKYFGLRFRGTDSGYLNLKAAQIGNRLLQELFGIKGSLGSTLVWSNLEQRRKVMYKTPFGIPEGTEQVSYNMFTNYGASWNPDMDKIIYTSHTEGGTIISVQQLNPLRYKSISVFAEAGKASSPYWAPDGSVFLTLHISDQNSDIVQYKINGSPYAEVAPELKMVKKWTFNKTIETEPQISPDGAMMAFVSDQTAAPQIYLMNLKTGKVNRLTKKGGYNVTPAWSPNSKLIAYRGIRNKVSSVYRIDVKTGIEKRITGEDIDAESPTWSPDGSLIAFTGKPKSDSTDIMKISYMLASGGEYHRAVKTSSQISETNPRWGPALQ